MNKILVIKYLVLASVLSSFMSEAAISLDRTRAIYISTDKILSLNVNNDNKKYPFLAQVWIEDENYKKISTPILALPPIQRINAGEKAIVNITKILEAERLPKDRESLFYFNLREIPPKSDKKNVMQITLQSKIKLFYRPVEIIKDKDYIWQKDLVLRKTATGLIIDNPTAYYISLSQLYNRLQSEGGKALNGFDPVMVAPKSSTTVKMPASLLNTFVLTYINDYGGYIELPFSCDGGKVCRVNKK